MLIDTHLHLDFDHYDDDRDEVVARAVDAGVEKMITIGIDRGTCRRAMRLIDTYDAVYGAVGIHPNSATDWGDDARSELLDYVQHPDVVAIGEIGLDYYWDKASPQLQHEVFRAQLDLAAEVEIPVIIHNREADDDVLAMLCDWVTDVHPGYPPGVLHFFSGDLEMAREAEELGFYFGVDGPLTFRNAEEMREVAKALPIERLLVETDAPFLTPQPHRGKRNEPAYVRFVAEQLASLHNMSLDEIARRTTENAYQLFPKLES